jgi:hypothetical protein
VHEQIELSGNGSGACLCKIQLDEPAYLVGHEDIT